jgi:hypothetical protein
VAGQSQQLTSPSRRLSTRVEASRGVWVYWRCDGRDDIAPVRDLSVGGVFIETPKPREVGITTNLHFLCSEGQIRADAIVRHADAGRGLGLKFTAVREEDRPHLMALMSRLRSSL